MKGIIFVHIIIYSIQNTQLRPGFNSCFHHLIYVMTNNIIIYFTTIRNKYFPRFRIFCWYVAILNDHYNVNSKNNFKNNNIINM